MKFCVVCCCFRVVAKPNHLFRMTPHSSQPHPPHRGSFLLFEAACGVYFPALASLRTMYVPEAQRAAVMNFYRVPLNALVVVVLAAVGDETSPSLVLGVAASFLAAALALQVWLASMVGPSGGNTGGSGRLLDVVPADGGAGSGRADVSRILSSVDGFQREAGHRGGGHQSSSASAASSMANELPEMRLGAESSSAPPSSEDDASLAEDPAWNDPV